MKSIGKENLVQSIFGGLESDVTEHDVYNIKVQSLNDSYACQLEVLDQSVICNSVSRLENTDNKIFNILKKNKIVLSDIGRDMPDMDILLGADTLNKNLTGKILKN